MAALERTQNFEREANARRALLQKISQASSGVPAADLLLATNFDPETAPTRYAGGGSGSGGGGIEGSLESGDDDI